MALLLISHKALAALDVFAAHIPRVFREPAAVSGRLSWGCDQI